MQLTSLHLQHSHLSASLMQSLLQNHRSLFSPHDRHWTPARSSPQPMSKDAYVYIPSLSHCSVSKLRGLFYSLLKSLSRIESQLLTMKPIHIGTHFTNFLLHSLVIPWPPKSPCLGSPFRESQINTRSKIARRLMGQRFQHPGQRPAHWLV